VDLLARAFRDNPLNVAALAGFDPGARVRANAAGMRATLATALAHGRVLAARGAGRPRGVLVATPPGGWPLLLPPLGLRLRALLGQGLAAARRWREVFDALAAEHPVAPHAYLCTLGVDPAHQRRGAGRALLAAWLAALDRDGARAYLETDRAENVAFYGRAGFRVVGETPVLGVRVWRMERPAARGAAGD
jgi:ribosomal protein S18 acetylase RimI-like enzyme